MALYATNADCEVSRGYKRLSDDIAEKTIQETVDVEKIAKELQWIESYDRKKVVRSFARLVLELRESIDSYDTIIGDDVGGRLPTRFIRALMNSRRSQEKKAETFFLAMGHNNDKKSIGFIEDFISKREEELGRVLMVTEHIEDGDGLDSWVKKFMERGIDIELASVSVVNPTNTIKRFPYMKNLRYGSVDKTGLDSFYDTDGAGVVKSYGYEDDRMSAHVSRDHWSSHKPLRDARADMEYLARELAVLLNADIGE